MWPETDHVIEHVSGAVSSHHISVAPHGVAGLDLSLGDAASDQVFGGGDLSCGGLVRHEVADQTET